MAKKEKHHPFSHTTTHHFKDGSGHTTHHHESGDSKKDVSYAHLDHDGMMDGMQQNLSPEMAGGGAGGAEEAMEAGAAGGAGPAGGGGGM
jgi:hypothetical protein